MVEYADEDGKFCMYDVDDVPTWTIAGDSTKPSMPMKSNAHLGTNCMTPYSHQARDC